MQYKIQLSLKSSNKQLSFVKIHPKGSSKDHTVHSSKEESSVALNIMH